MKLTTAALLSLASASAHAEDLRHKGFLPHNPARDTIAELRADLQRAGAEGIFEQITGVDWSIAKTMPCEDYVNMLGNDGKLTTGYYDPRRNRLGEWERECYRGEKLVVHYTREEIEAVASTICANDTNEPGIKVGGVRVNLMEEHCWHDYTSDILGRVYQDGVHCNGAH